MASVKSVELNSCILCLALAISIVSVCLSLAGLSQRVFAPKTQCTCVLAKGTGEAFENATKSIKTSQAEKQTVRQQRSLEDVSLEHKRARKRRENVVGSNPNYYSGALTQVQQQLIVLDTR